MCVHVGIIFIYLKIKHIKYKETINIMYSQFNALATKFLTKMYITFPQEKKVSDYKHEFDTMNNMIRLGVVAEDAPVKKFMYNMYDFGEKILGRDEMFFKKDEFVDNAESISGKMGLIDYWDDMKPDVQEEIWKYVQGLYMLGMASIGKQDELQAMIIKTNYQVE